MRHARIAALVAFIASISLCVSAMAAPLGTMTLEGQLLTVAGSPVPDGDYTLKVSFYKDKQALKALHSETSQIKLVGGGFVFTLGLVQPLKAEIFQLGDAAWVGIQVGTDPELPRLPLNHVAYAFRAEAAKSLACTGCVKTEHLAKDVLAPFALKTDLKFAGSDQACPKGQHMVSFDKDGKVVCSKTPTYSGKDFALSKQSCPLGQLVAGVDDQGKVKCAIDGGATYNGKDFALSKQTCPKGEVASGVGEDGKLVCFEIKTVSYSGKDFALSDQKCGKGKVMQDIGPDGKVVCVANPSAVLSGDQVTNLSQNKLANGKTPWTDPKSHTHGYDVDSPWLHDNKDDANVKLFGNKRQLVMRTDGSLEYNKGVGSYPFVWMFGGDVALNRMMALSEKGELWTSKYGWLHERFAATKTQCAKGKVMRGVLADGNPDCVVDQDSKTVYKANLGVKLAGDTFSADLPYLDKRYVNEQQKDAITSPMIIDGQVAKADLAKNSVDGAKVVDSSLTGSDIKDGSLTGSDVLNSSLTGSDIKDSTLTGSDILDSSLTSADIKNNSLTSADILDSSLTGTDIKNATLTGADVFDHSLTAADVDSKSVQVRVSTACPDGQAIRAIASDGKVTCVSDTGADFAKFAGKLKTGRWYRIASSSNGAQVAGTFHIYDATYGGSMTVRVGISKGAEGTMDVSLLHNDHAGTALFTQMRVLESGSTKAHYVELRANKDADAWFYLNDNNHSQVWKAEKWVDRGTAGTAAGWGNRFFELDKLLMVGGEDDRLSVMRSGVTRVQTKYGYMDLGAQSSSYAYLNTDRSKFYFNKGLRVDEGIISSHNENLTFQTSGTTRAWLDNSGGQLNTNSGIRACVKNATGCGLTISDDGGFYDQNDGWIRNQVTNGLLIRDKANKDYRDLHARHITAHGNLESSGTLISSGAATFKSSASVGSTLTVGSTLSVGGTLAANNGVSVDGHMVVDNGAGWHRTTGKTGWYNDTYKGGINMEDSSYVRVYGNKHFIVPGNYVVRADGGFQVDGKQVIDNDGGWHRSTGKTGWYNDTYKGGINMEDSTWVRVVGKKFYSPQTMRTDGYLGVGGDPTYPLHVKKAISNNWSALFTNGSSNVYLAHYSGYGMSINTGQLDNKGGYLMSVANKSGTALYVKNNRYVGVRTSAPGYPLDVSGSTRLNGSVGISATPPTGSYKLSVGGNINMNHHELNYASQIHFYGGTKLQNLDSHYLGLRWDNATYGGLRLQDGNSKTQGYLYADGDQSYPSIGLLDSDGSWAVQVRRDDYVRFLVNNSEKMRIKSNGRVGINTNNPGYTLEVNGSFQADSITVGSKSLGTYIRDYVNTYCYIYFGWRDSVNGANYPPTKYGKVKPGYCKNLAGGDNSCWYGDLLPGTGTNLVRMFALNTDGTVNGDDKFYIGFKCD